MTAGPLVAGYDLVIFDLDGVLYLGDQVIPGAVDAVGALRRGGVGVAYATNNASRSAAAVAALLTSLGIGAEPADVVTSAGVTAAMLARRFGPGAPVLVVGAPALRADVLAAGLHPVDGAEDKPAVVVQGYGPAVGWADLAEACVAVRAGAAWYATNVDLTLPSPRGPLPGNGSLVAALRAALGRGPDVVVGKPDPGLFLAAAGARGAQRPLVVGDRVDTDVEGARRAGMDSMLVLTGVSRGKDLLAAPPAQRPTFVAPDLAGLSDPAAVVAVADPAAAAAVADPAAAVAVPATMDGGWRVRRDGTRWVLAGDGSPLVALAALCRAMWAVPEPSGDVVAEGGAASDVLRQFGLDG